MNTIAKKVCTFLILVLSIFAISCDSNNGKELILEGPLKVEVNNTINLEVSINFESTEKFEWFSSNTDIATVENGIVKGINVGKTTITVRVGKMEKSIEIEVTPINYTFDISGDMVLNVGETSKITVKVTPKVKESELVFASSDNDIFEVDEDGKIYGKKAGKATLKISYDNNSSSVEITVLEEDIIKVTITGNNKVRVGKLIALKANIDVIWTSSDSNIADIDDNGEIIAVSPGKVVITATDKKNLDNYKTFELEVLGQIPTSITINGRNKIGLNQTTTLEITTKPVDADKSVIWSSKDESVVTVDKNGVVSAVNIGKTNIKVTAQDDNSIIAVFAIEVIEATPTDVIITGKNELTAGELASLSVEVIGDNVSRELVWTTSNKTVAIVENGMVLALKEGNATIKATSVLNDQVYGEISVKVNKYVAPTESTEDLAFVNKIIDSLTLEEKVGQLFIGSYSGTTLTSDAINAIEKYKLGNFIYMGYNTPSGVVAGNFTIELQNKFVSTLKIPGFICIDQEGGRVTRLFNGGTRFMSNMSVAATGNPENAYLIGEAVGEELKTYGINFDLAPVLDVNNNPNNPVINNRSYSDNSVTVSMFGSKMIEGLMSSDVMSCAKHFPGHGNTSTDSHTGLPKITTGIDDLYSIELAPFINAIYAGIDSIMTTHIIFSSIDKEYPATLSKSVLTDLLRNELGFNGIIVTDGMEMAAIADNYGVGQAAVLAVKAGADMLAYTTIANPIIGINAILASVKNGEITEERINDSVRRILLKKLKYDLFNNYLPKDNFEIYDTTKNSQLNLEIAKQGVTVHLGDFAGLDKNKSTIIFSTNASLSLENGLSSDNNSFGYVASNYLKLQGFTKCDYVNITSLTSADIASKVALSQKYEQIIIAVDDAKGTKRSLVNQIAAVRNDIIVIALNLPYDINNYTNVNNYICIYDHTPVMVDALKRLLNGEYMATGKSPITLQK